MAKPDGRYAVSATKTPMPVAPVSMRGEGVSDATEVMDCDSLPEEILAELRKGPRGVTVQMPETEDDESPSERSAFLRRQWLSDSAAAVDTAKTDDIAESPTAQPFETDRSIRVRRVEARLAEVEDAAEGNVAETDRAIRLARKELAASASGRASTPPPTSIPPRRQLPLVLLFVVLGLGVGAALVAFLVRR